LAPTRRDLFLLLCDLADQVLADADLKHPDPHRQILLCRAWDQGFRPAKPAAIRMMRNLITRRLGMADSDARA
jgi:hypothetical protein